jgi:hypothetical protein
MCFFLDCDGEDVTCPHCGAKWHVDWITEYGDPLLGEHDTECPRCHKPFSFSVYHEYNSWAKP